MWIILVAMKPMRNSWKRPDGPPPSARGLAGAAADAYCVAYCARSQAVEALEQEA